MNWTTIQSLIKYRTPEELAVGFARYEALRKLKPYQFEELHKRNLAGENFDAMVDELVATDPSIT